MNRKFVCRFENMHSPYNSLCLEFVIESMTKFNDHFLQTLNQFRLINPESDFKIHLIFHALLILYS